jgi:hypothetical protein
VRYGKDNLEDFASEANFHPIVVLGDALPRFLAAEPP